MKRILFILLTLAIPVLLFAAEPVREWKTKSGKTFKASLEDSQDLDSETVFFLKDGKRYKFPLKNLSQADQDYITNVRKLSLEDDGLEEISEKESRGISVVPAGNQYALLIGVNKYVKPIESLQFCVKDMELLSDCFQKLGIPKENIFLVTDNSPVERRPTGAIIRRQIENITSIMGPNDQLIIAFSGHGVMVDGNSYLCPSDTDLEDQNTVVSREWVFEQLEKCKAKQKVFIIDACRNELSFRGGKALGKARTLNDPIGADTHGFVLIASCDKKQQSWENPDIQHGVFSYFLAEGLAGAAKDEDGYVTIMNLFQYASSKTKKFVLREYSKAQVPTIRQGGEMTDFCLAKLATPASSFPPSVAQQPSPSQSEVQQPSIAPSPVQRPSSSPSVVQQPYIPPSVVESPSPSLSRIQTPSSTLSANERKVYNINGVEFAFIYCPPGRLMRGSSEITIAKSFWIMETEITQKQWKAVMRNNPSNNKDDDFAVENVSWYDCQEFCKICSRLGLPVQLPTEAQWEYACRAESANARSLDEMTCYWEDNDFSSHPVGTNKPNDWGLYDMHGNLWEWCQDSKVGYSNESESFPSNSSSSSYRVLRGGGWDIIGSYYPNVCAPEFKDDRLGFRCVKAQ